jgi:hypothetical protein
VQPYGLFVSCIPKATGNELAQLLDQVIQTLVDFHTLFTVQKVLESEGSVMTFRLATLVSLPPQPGIHQGQVVGRRMTVSVPYFTSGITIIN